MNADLPAVSVVLPVYNGERFLRESIESVIATQYPRLEIIVVDGQSSDRTPAIAQSFEQVRFIGQRDHGLAAAYNCGVAASSGDLIAFQAADDLWTPDKLQVQVGYLLTHPDVQYTVARATFFLEPGFASPAGFKQELLLGDHPARILETLVARKSLFNVVGRFDPDIAISMDVDWFSRASDRGIPMAAMEEVLLRRRVHDANLSLQPEVNNRNYNRELLEIFKKSIARKRNTLPSSGGD